MHLIKIPDVRQATDHGCASACIDALCDFWSRRRPPRDLANHVQGMAPETVESVFRDRGFQVMRGELYTPLLQALTKTGVPVMCAVTIEDCGHWVIVRGVGCGKVYYHDPEVGPTSVRVKDWEEIWEGYSEAGQQYHRWGIAPHLT
jgi:ABC-type bacteriocin/lantibiotic exporter with double-glycine peptidase domain